MLTSFNSSFVTSQGQALIVAPRRGNTLQQFVDVASNLFSDEGVQILENYDPFITDLHSQVFISFVKSVCTSGVEVIADWFISKFRSYFLRISLYKLYVECYLT